MMYNGYCFQSIFLLHCVSILVCSLLCLQAMTAIVRDFKQHVISEDELRLLLSFVEEDIYDYQRQSTAFPLLKVGLRNVMGCLTSYSVCIEPGVELSS